MQHPEHDATHPGADGGRDERLRHAMERIGVALRGLRYGTVTAVVQDGVVVQVERTEKVRLEKRTSTSSP